MNTRKFYLITSVVISIFLFLSGSSMLFYLNILNSEDSNVSSANAAAQDTGSNPLKDILNPFISKKDPVNVLLLGGDKVAHNTDTMMLINFNPATAKTSILSIPRDTKVKVKGSSVPKINSAFPIGGPELAIETVSNLLNVNINYYIFIDTSAFRKIIDELDGVDYNVPVNMDYDDPTQNLHIHLKKGQQKLYGAQAEQYMRFRHPNYYPKNSKELMQYYDGSDLKRIDAQQNFLKEFIRQKANVYYLTKISGIANILFNSIQTNMDLNTALKLAQNLSKLNADEIKMFKLPGEDSNEPNGWFYVHYKEKSAEIVSEYFNAKGGFANDNTGNNNLNGNDDKGDSQPITNKSSVKSNSNKGKSSGSGTKKSYTKDNPSNSDTKMKPIPGDKP